MLSHCRDVNLSTPPHAEASFSAEMATVTASVNASLFDDAAHACPICRETYVDAFSTLCGHTFCFACINQHLEHGSTCPCCSQPLSSDSLFPNLALDKLLRDLSKSGGLPSGGTNSPRDGMSLPTGFGGCRRGRASELAEAVTDLPLEQLTPLLRVIADKHKRLVMDDRQVSMHVLRDFLSLSWRRKNEAVDSLEAEMRCIDDDLEWVERQVSELGGESALDAFVEETRRMGRNGTWNDRIGLRQGCNDSERSRKQSGASTSSANANNAASMVCEMLSAWGIDAPANNGRRTSRDNGNGGGSPRHFLQGLQRISSDERKGTGAHGSKRSSMDMIKGVGPSKQPGGDELFRNGSGSSEKSEKDKSNGWSPEKFLLPAAPMDQTVARAHLAKASLSEEKRRKIVNHFAGLQRLYSEIRGRASAGFEARKKRHANETPSETYTKRVDLERFSDTVAEFSSKNRLRVVGELKHADLLSTSPSASIVSSIEFDFEKRIFATAGVSRRIQFFDFRDVCGAGESTSNGPDATQSIVTRSKLSCLSYNPCVNNHVASADYEGVVTVWDVATKQAVCEFEEHDKRAWTVDYCSYDPKLLASGSDDGRVKIWSTDSEASVLELDVRANVCCAQYGPNDTHTLAVGCADHRVHLFDLRKPNEAVAVLSGHRKATSYVRFLSQGKELVSASTDSTLCVWDVRADSIKRSALGLHGNGSFGAMGSIAQQTTRLHSTRLRQKKNTQPGLKPVRVLEGHVNEKNFVGLSVGGGDLIACGSETNEVFVYHKSFDQPMVKYGFDDDSSGGDWSCANASSGGRGGGRNGAAADADTGGPAMPAHFISATCWRGEDDILLVANSNGSIKALQLVEE